MSLFSIIQIIFRILRVFSKFPTKTEEVSRNNENVNFLNDTDAK